MKKHILLISNIVIILSIIAGFTAIVYRDTKAYQQLAEKHLENVVSLADTDISNHISNFMNKPVMVSKTMANDEFLKAWLREESVSAENDAYMSQLYDYLKAYQEKYGYTTVFCISAKTGRYYYQDGLNKTISKKDPHDIWYYNFIKSGHEYDLEVDTNQANHNNITVFVNFRVVDDNGKLLGVIGVGLKASFIEDTILSYEKSYDLSVYIVNVGGATNSFNKDTDIFVKQDRLPEYVGIKQKINLNKSGKSEIQWFTSDGERKCLITKYDDNLRWFLVLKMETNSISSAFQKMIMNNILFMLLTLAMCIIVTTAVFIYCNKRIVTMENTDELTGLLNRKLFSEKYLPFIQRYSKEKKMLFMLDIDHFKEVNDSYGHILGDEILAMVADKLRKAVNGHGIEARWGGDEFIGMIAVESGEAVNILKGFMDSLKNDKKYGSYSVTVSVGIVAVNEGLSMEQMVCKADEQLYLSKENGRNRITVDTL